MSGGFGIGWETVDGSQGGLSIVHRVATDISGFGWTSYYLDQKNPSGSAQKQCTGDAAAYGSSGAWIAQAIPNTDPLSSPFKTLVDSRILFFESPGAANGPRRSSQVASRVEPTWLASS